MMSWIIQIGLFSLLSLRQLIYAWVPRGRLQLSTLCLNPRLPVLGNKPAMIINHWQDFFNPHPQRNLKSKYLICNSSGVYLVLQQFLACVSHDGPVSTCIIFSLSYWSIPFMRLSMLASSMAKIFPSTPYLFALVIFFLSFIHLFIQLMYLQFFLHFQRTRSPMASPPLIWVHS